MATTRQPNHLGRLRAHIELQLRYLVDAERAIETLPFRADVQRSGESARLVTHLAEMQEAHHAMGDAIATALEAAMQLRDRQPGAGVH